MIYDTLNNLPNYLGMSDNLDTVIEYIMARDINTLPAGKTRIDGDNALVTVSTITPQASEKAPFVRHDAHLTLETDLEGSELFEVSLGEFSPTKPADEYFADDFIRSHIACFSFISQADAVAQYIMCHCAHIFRDNIATAFDEGITACRQCQIDRCTR